MNRIWNSAYGDNNNLKKISNTVNFKIGQSVYGRIVKTLDVNQAIIKLLNGMELQAELEEGISDFNNGLIQFQVKGMKDNKLQLKLLESNTYQDKNLNSEIMKFINSEGLSKDDNKLLQGMLKYDLNLTKDNISNVKSLLEFNERIKLNEGEIDTFIDKFINSKGVSQDNISKESIAKELKTFFNNFKTLTADDILLFLENDIEFTSENINSYKAIFKGSDTINNVLKGMTNGMEENILTNKNIESEAQIINYKDIENNKESSTISPNGISNNNIIEESSNNISKEQLNFKEIENNSSIVKEGLKALDDTLKDNSLKLTKDEIVKVFNQIKDLPSDKLEKPVIKELLEEVLGKNIEMSDDNVEKIFKAVKEVDNTVNKFNEKQLQGNAVKDAINNKSEEVKEIVSKLLSQLGDDEKDLSQVINSLKNNINDVKLFNKFSNEYYYLNLPVNFHEQEYPCKLIIKDNRKDGKQLDSKNIKLALNVNTKSLGSVDGFVKVLNKSMEVNISCQKEYMKVFELSKGKLKETIDGLGFITNIVVTEKEYDLDLTTCREFFGENNVAGIDIKV